jgi:carbamoyltransferase
MSEPIVIGVARTHDVAVTLFRGSNLLGIAEAERTLDIKHARGPESVEAPFRELLDELGIRPSDIDAVAIADTGREKLETLIPSAVADMHGPCAVATVGTGAMLNDLPLAPLNLGLREDVSVHAVCHHAAHAAGAVYQSGFDECAVLVADGYGVCCGTMAYKFANGRLDRLEKFRDAALLGWRYQLFGHLTKEISSEKTDNLDLSGKVMGLNAYGVPQENLVQYFERWFFDGTFGSYERSWDATREWFGDILPRPLTKDGGSVSDPHYLNVVASMQEAFSRVVEQLSTDALEAARSRNLVFSGGCALNVLANTRSAGVAERIFLQPAAGDNGLSLGAAAAASAHLMGISLHHPGATNRGAAYLGLSVRDDVSAEMLDGLTFDDCPEAEAARSIANGLAAGEIVGVVRGRAEIGPRALGNRSILASGADPNMRNVLNQSIKNREWWRPFAPVCRSIDSDRYFDAPSPSPYMLTVATVKENYKTAFASACHADGTARLQVVPDRDWNPLLWDTLTEFERLTGIGVLINTSFNEGGKPILNKARTALKMLKGTNMGAVWINGKLYRKLLRPVTIL